MHVYRSLVFDTVYSYSVPFQVHLSAELAAEFLFAEIWSKSLFSQRKIHQKVFEFTCISEASPIASFWLSKLHVGLRDSVKKTETDV